MSRTAPGPRAIPLLALTASAAVTAPPPTVRAGDIALRLQRVSLVREGAYTPGPSGTPLPGSGITGSAVLEFRLGSRTPEALDGLVRGPLAESFTARDDLGKQPRVRSEIVEQDDAPVLRLTVEGLSPAARALRNVQGGLQAYPGARRIRFHVPWLKDEVPVRVDVHGGTATLRRFQLVGADSTLWISIRPPEGYRVADPSLPGALSARAVDIDGNLVNAGGVTRIERTREGAEPEFRFFAPALRRTPSRLMVDVLCVSGPPRRLPFQVPEIRLPRGR